MQPFFKIIRAIVMFLPEMNCLESFSFNFSSSSSFHLMSSIAAPFVLISGRNARATAIDHNSRRGHVRQRTPVSFLVCVGLRIDTLKGDINNPSRRRINSILRPLSLHSDKNVKRAMTNPLHDLREYEDKWVALSGLDGDVVAVGKDALEAQRR